MFQSIAFAAPSKTVSTSLNDLILSYSYELEAKSQSEEDSELIKSLFSAKVSAYMDQNGPDLFRKELQGFLNTLPVSDQTILLQTTANNKNASPEELQEALVKIGEMDKAIAGDSANWSLDIYNRPWAFLATVVTVALVTYLVVDAIVEDEEEYGSDNDQTGSVDGTERIVLYFYGDSSFSADYDSEEDDYDCDWFSGSYAESSAISEARYSCRNDYRVRDEGLTSACSGYVSTSISQSGSTCYVDATLTVSYTIGD